MQVWILLIRYSSEVIIHLAAFELSYFNVYFLFNIKADHERHNSTVEPRIKDV